MNLREKLINYEGLEAVTSWIKEKFVQVETGKGLSEQNYTKIEKDKVAGIPDDPKYTDTVADLTPYLKSSDAATTYATKDEVLGVDVSDQLKNYQKVESKGIAGGYASLGADGKVPTAQLPDDKDTITTINGKTGAITKADIVALGIPAQDNDTKYNVVTSNTDGLMSKNHLTKLLSIADNADVSPITTIKRNGTIVNPVNKVVDISIPTKLSSFTNDSGFLTDAQVQELISNARYMKKELVTTLPTQGDENTIYLIKGKGKTGNVYEERMYINGAWELIGTTETDLNLKDYVKIADLQVATVSEIRELFA